MASKPKATEPKKDDPSNLRLGKDFLKPGELEKVRDGGDKELAKMNAVVAARALAMPEVTAASIMQSFQGDVLNVNLAVTELREQVAEVQQGNMKRPEAMLVAQAHALDTLFCVLARRAHGYSKDGYTDTAEKYLRLALKAQSQCRTTVETLAEIKNPRPVAFVKQANIANGPQQVNNGELPRSTHAGALARENAIPSSELLQETINYGAMDPGAEGATGRTNQELATVGEIDRATHARRQNSFRKQ